jgi:hypothetical protein
MRGTRAERLTFCFVVGLLIFNPPILAIFDAPETVFGVPLLYAYLFAAWAALIAFAGFAIERAEPAEPDDPDATPHSPPSRGSKP